MTGVSHFSEPGKNTYRVIGSAIVSHRALMKFNKQHRSYPVGAQFIGAPPIYKKPSVICTNCTPLNTVSSGSTPGLNRGRKGKTPKIYGANAPQLHPICRRQPEKLIRPPSGYSRYNCNKCDNCDKPACDATTRSARRSKAFRKSLPPRSQESSS